MIPFPPFRPFEILPRHLSLLAQKIFVDHQAFQPDEATGMNLVRTDADFQPDEAMGMSLVRAGADFQPDGATGMNLVRADVDF